MTKPVVVFGTGDFARVAAVYLRDDSPHEVVGFTVHADRITKSKLSGIEVVPFETLAQTHPPTECDMYVAIGFKHVNRARATLYGLCKQAGYNLISYVNSRASVCNEVAIGDNCFIFENNVIQPFVNIGDDVVIWSGNHIGHDSQIGDHCFIASHSVISGNVKIGSHCFVGVNSTFRDGVRIGSDCVIGAGAIILRDTNPGEVYAAEATPLFPRASHELKSFK